MEHAALHALLLSGLIVALGGPIAVLWLIFPAARTFTPDADHDRFTASMLQSVARWIRYGAFAAILATFIDFFVQIAELQGQTVFGGADFSMVIRYATRTIVGQLCLVRVALLLLTACATGLPACAAGLRGRRHWWFVAVLALGSVIATSLVSHAAAQPENRPVAIAAQIAHITASALWMGVLLHLFFARGIMFSSTSQHRVAFIAEMVRRFAPVALAMTSLLGITGVIAAYRYLSTPGLIFESPYGLTLVIKIIMLTPAIYAGYINFKFIGPRLLGLATTENEDPITIGGVFSWFSRTLELEVTSGLLVITVAGILGSVSPPADDGSQRLTSVQAHTLITPHRPNTDIRGWNEPDNPRDYTDANKRYSTFTHNWDGLAVCLMGVGWMAQSMRGRIGLWGSRLSPFLLVPFGLFIAFASNPELWLLHQVDPWTALTNPGLLEHQLASAMVLLLAWLSWRDRKNPEEKRPLGYPLPIVMIAGSILLIGHAHSATTMPDDLTNLINVQHAILGSFVLFAGTSRLLILRRLLPAPAARIARFFWPACIIGLGLFMAFFYSELP